MGFEKFSRTNSKFKLEIRDGNKTIVKEAQLNLFPINKINYLHQKINSYYETLSSVISMPKMIESKVKNEKIIFKVEFLGDGNNLFQLTENNPSELLRKELISQIINIIKLIIKNKLFFDPHLKNFIVDKKGKVYYVDFSPPYSDNYNIKVLKYQKEENKKLVSDNLGFFSYEMVPFHFVADLIKSNSKFNKITKNLFEIFVEEKLINNNYDLFLEKINKIKKVELERENKEIFLI